MGLLAAVAARSPLTLAGSSGQVIEVAECYCSPSICRLQLIDARPERSRQCQPQCCTPTSYWSLGAGTWVCAHWCAVSQAAFFQEHTLGSRSTQLGERGKSLRWESKWTTLELILPCDLERTRSGMEPQAFVLVFLQLRKERNNSPPKGGGQLLYSKGWYLWVPSFLSSCWTLTSGEGRKGVGCKSGTMGYSHKHTLHVEGGRNGYLWVLHQAILPTQPIDILVLEFQRTTNQTHIYMRLKEWLLRFTLQCSVHHTSLISNLPQGCHQT